MSESENSNIKYIERCACVRAASHHASNTVRLFNLVFSSTE